jgi:hypothetical protein
MPAFGQKITLELSIKNEVIVMPAVKFTMGFVSSAICEEPAVAKISYYDSVVSGLVLEVHKSGRKTFFLDTWTTGAV